MQTSDYFELMAQYNQWINGKIYAVCAEIPDDMRKKDLGAFFKSIDGTLNHILYGDKAWLGRFTKQSLTSKSIGQELYQNFDALWAERSAMDQEILHWSQNLSSPWLETPFEYTSNTDGKTRIMPTWVLVTHMFNHQTHHRGQVTTLIKQLGYEPGIVDLPWLAHLDVNTGNGL
ncbi:damage-inducible protein DinB [Synechocystis sp. PCC 7339]|uniref:DinB family protein n=1 Tax=Synechocystis sp. PCC 7339 TaxID=2782213 RepID=UPI001CBDF040|nr:DinB family protein [Synechocystis sp. PCC 7339]UAJ72282.1 damage-inducible protein DinB [Synechocystis sp. PCC 7339]